MKRDGGFTLIEMLVSLGIMAMLAMMLASGLHSARRAWERQDAAAAGSEIAASVQPMLRGLIERAYPLTSFNGGSPYVTFRGRDTYMSFVGQPPAANSPAALRLYRLAMGPGGALMLYSKSSLAAPDGAEQAQVLMRRVRGLEIAYYGAAPPAYTLTWRAAWEDQPSLPQLVRIRVAMAPQDRTPWPDLIIHPAATVDSQCVLEPATGKCRGRS